MDNVYLKMMLTENFEVQKYDIWLICKIITSYCSFPMWNIFDVRVCKCSPRSTSWNSRAIVAMSQDISVEAVCFYACPTATAWRARL